MSFEPQTPEGKVRSEKMKNNRLISQLSTDTSKDKIKWDVSRDSFGKISFKTIHKITPNKEIDFYLIRESNIVNREKNLLRAVFRINNLKPPYSSNSSVIKSLTLEEYPSLIRLINLMDKYIKDDKTLDSIIGNRSLYPVNRILNTTRFVPVEIHNVYNEILKHDFIKSTCLASLLINVHPYVKNENIFKYNTFLEKWNLKKFMTSTEDKNITEKLCNGIKEYIKNISTNWESDALKKLVVAKNFDEYKKEIIKTISDTINHLPKTDDYMDKFGELFTIRQDMYKTKSYGEIGDLMYKAHLITALPIKKKKPPIIGNKWG